MLRLIPSFLMLVCVLNAPAQDISGYWKGKLMMGAGGCFPVYQIELQLTVSNGQIQGKAYHFSDSSNYISDAIVGSWDSIQRTAIIRETGIVTFRINEECVPCLKTYTLKLHSGGGNRVRETQLRGDWSTPSGRAIDGKTPCAPGSIVLTRSERASFTESKPKPIVKPPKIDQLVQEIRLDSGEVQLAMYDNGQVDGDTVSVYVNKKPILVNQMLKTQPLTLKIKVDPQHPIQEVVMVGENLGLIPPNTALMIVTTAQNRYQLYLTADEGKNALVRFIYDPGAKKN